MDAMPSTIAILEDDPERTCELTTCLRERFPEIRTIVFDNAPDMIHWLDQHMHEAELICLDHDLGPNRERAGESFDPGTGRDVADLLGARQPACPILIHSTNSCAAPGMEMVLDDSGWTHARIMPYEGLTWIREAWIEKVAELLRKN
jgi:hypothetical protein